MCSHTTGTGSAPNYPTDAGQATGGSRYDDAPKSGYASQVTGGTGTTALASGDNTTDALGQGSAHKFGEITDHRR